MSDFALHLRELAAPWPRGEKVQIAISRAARQADLAYWRAYDIWYRKARRVEPAEQQAIADALKKKRQQETRNELHELRTRIIRLEALLARGEA